MELWKNLASVNVKQGVSRLSIVTKPVRVSQNLRHSPTRATKEACSTIKNTKRFVLETSVRLTGLMQF